MSASLPTADRSHEWKETDPFCFPLLSSAPLPLLSSCSRSVFFVLDTNSWLCCSTLRRDRLSAGIIVAGWDEDNGGTVYNIPLGGGTFKAPWAIAGSGSTYVYGYCDATYREDFSKEETVDFVRDSKSTFRSPPPSPLYKSDISACSSRFGHVARRIFRWYNQNGHHHKGGRRARICPGRSTPPLLGEGVARACAQTLHHLCTRVASASRASEQSRRTRAKSIFRQRHLHFSLPRRETVSALRWQSATFALLETCSVV